MPECSYCGATFDDEQSHLTHLKEEHEGELGTIDQRRVEEELDTEDDVGVPVGPLVLGIVLAVSVLLVGYVVFIHGSGGGESTVNGIDVAQTPGQVSQSEHGHGLINVTIDGQELDFSRQEFQNPGEYRAFHFENGNGRIWHKHASGVTLEYGMATLGIEVTESSVTYDGTTYRDSDPGTSVNVTVNGNAVDPASYELDGAGENSPGEGDFIRISVTTES